MTFARHGLIEPIVTFEGKILDGRCRWIACEMARVEPRFEEYTGNKPREFLFSKNLHRRHLYTLQIGNLTQEEYEMAAEGDKLSERILYLNPPTGD